MQKEDTVEHQHSLQKHASSELGSAASGIITRHMVQESWLMLEYCDIGTLSVSLPLARTQQGQHGHNRVNDAYNRSM